MLENNIAVHYEVSKLDDHEGEVGCLSQKNPNHNQMEQEVALDEAHGLNPHSQVLFRDPFASFLETFEKGVKYARSSLLQGLKKILGITIKKQVRLEWPFYFFSTLKEMNKYH